MAIAHPTLAHALREAWSHPERAGRVALESAEETLTYAALARRVQGFAGALASAGVRRGDRILIAMERSPDAVIAILAAQFAGACPCPLEPLLSAVEIDRRIAATGLTHVVFDAAHAALADATTLPEGRRIRFRGDEADGAPSFDEGVGGADPALLLFTSGSTGHPKGVLLSHGNLLSNAAGVIAHTRLTPADALLHVMPIYHTNGLNNQLFAPLLTGSRVVLAGRFRAEEMPALMARHRPTIVTGVPTMYSRILDLAFDPESLRGLRFARCGSAPITEELHRRVEAKLGCPLVVSYGLSEATCTSLMNPPERRRIGTVGTVLAGQSVRIRDPRSGRDLETGSEGEVVIGGPSVMLGYLGAPEEADRAVRDGWVRTGDLGRFDADGYLTITGRIKDVVIRGGENLSPGLFESAIARAPGVRSVCVVGRPDADLGEVPVACIVAERGAALDPRRVAELVAASLPHPYRLADVVLVESLPENALGKIDRKRVAAMIAAAGERSP